MNPRVGEDTLMMYPRYRYWRAISSETLDTLDKNPLIKMAENCI